MLEIGVKQQFQSTFYVPGMCLNIYTYIYTYLCMYIVVLCDLHNQGIGQWFSHFTVNATEISDTMTYSRSHPQKR